MNDLANIPGLYGKIPVRGDFVARRLTPHFVETWDRWLQSALSASKEQLGTQWLDIYLTSPIWHFVLSPGICGELPWTGILMPSVDKVGRYFPLTYAVSIDPSRKLSEIFIGALDWFKQMEQLALSALEDNLDLAELDRKLQAQPLPNPSESALTIGKRLEPNSRGDKLAFHMSMDKLEDMTDAFAQMGFDSLTSAHPTYSLWRTTGSASMKSCLRVYENLPPWDAFYELLVGREKREEQAAEIPAPSAPPDIDLGMDEDLGIDQEIKLDQEISLDQDITQEISMDQDPGKDKGMRSVDNTIENQLVRWRSSANTTVGKRRKVNEDAYLERPEIGLWAVADGMGGHSAGDIASARVMDALGNLAATGNLESYTAYAKECLRTANADLIEIAGSLGDGKIMGTTVVVMLAVGTRCNVIWAGDSRLYQFRAGTLTQLTKDHSLSAELSQQEILSDDKLDTKKIDNVVTRALGADPELSFDVITFEAEAEDLYLLCSDGLIKEVADQEIEEILNQHQCKKSVQDLIELSLERGARDNVTVVVAKTGQSGCADQTVCNQNVGK